MKIGDDEGKFSHLGGFEVIINILNLYWNVICKKHQKINLVARCNAKSYISYIAPT